MPDTRNLRWVEVKDFAPGLWENADWLMPATAAQTMLNCYPQPGGGLRAFFRGTTISVSGIADISKERATGAFARTDAMRAGAGSGIDRYLMTYAFDSGGTVGAKARPKLYRMDETNGESTWTQIFRVGPVQFNVATSDNNAPRQTSFRFFRLTDGTEYVVFALRYSGAVPHGPGLYKLNYATLSSSQIAEEITSSVTGAVNPDGPIATYQARFLIAHGGSGGERLQYSDPGTLTFGAANFIDVEPSEDGSAILAMVPQAAGDLLIAKAGAPWVSIQGDITDPTVVPMGKGEHAGSGEQDLVRLPDGGLVFSTSDGYVWETDGHTFTCLSQQLGSFPQQFDFTGQGALGFINQFLFVGRGYVFDIASKSWFKQNVMLGSIFNVELASRTVWGTTTTGTNFGLTQFSPFMNQARLGTYTWKSAPLRADDGRQMRVRQVQVYLKSYDANATCAVTVNGVTVTKTCSVTGEQALTFLFNTRAHVLDVQVVPTAGTSASNEAPSIDSIRIGLADGHMLSTPHPIT